MTYFSEHQESISQIRENLEETIAKIIAHPHTTIIKHDYQRAAKIMNEISLHISSVTNNLDMNYERYFSANLRQHLHEKYDQYDNSDFYQSIEI
jgi:hypothetical protein